MGTRIWLLAALAASGAVHGATAQDSTQTQPTAPPTPDVNATPAAKPAPAVKGTPAVKPSVAVNPAAVGKNAATAKTVAAGKSAAAARPRYKPDRFAGRAGTYYKMVWGVDSLGVKTVESGEIIRFSYRVLDADKAKTLNDEKTEPSLNDPRARVSLVVPSLEKVGKLRQSETPEEGKSYWMAFSNKGRLVKRGDRVNVVIGQFHADGLVVD
jgi:hypothetical protein